MLFEEELPDIYKEVGARIKAVRKMRGYSRAVLGDMVGLSSKFIYEVETGKKGFSAGNLYYICRALNVRSDYIMFGEKRSNYDKELNEVLALFDENQTQSLKMLLEAVYNLTAHNEEKD